MLLRVFKVHFAISLDCEFVLLLNDTMEDGTKRPNLGNLVRVKSPSGSLKSKAFITI